MSETFGNLFCPLCGKPIDVAHETTTKNGRFVEGGCHGCYKTIIVEDNPTEPDLEDTIVIELR